MEGGGEGWGFGLFRGGPLRGGRTEVHLTGSRWERFQESRLGEWEGVGRQLRHGGQGRGKGEGGGVGEGRRGGPGVRWGSV